MLHFFYLVATFPRGLQDGLGIRLLNLPKSSQFHYRARTRKSPNGTPQPACATRSTDQTIHTSRVKARLLPVHFFHLCYAQTQGLSPDYLAERQYNDNGFCYQYIFPKQSFLTSRRWGSHICKGTGWASHLERQHAHLDLTVTRSRLKQCGYTEYVTLDKYTLPFFARLAEFLLSESIDMDQYPSRSILCACCNIITCLAGV